MHEQQRFVKRLKQALENSKITLGFGVWLTVGELSNTIGS